VSTKAYENPLIPNQRLREMYLAMVQLRLLGKHLAGPRRKPGIPVGLEACWIASAIGLSDQTGDLISEPGVGSAFDVSLGIAPKVILKPAYAQSSSRLHSSSVPIERLTLALGASMALASAANKNVLLAYAHQSDLTKAQWKALLATALATESPVVFVILPDSRATFDVAALSQSCGVPGISVEATDAIAIYRVAQESLGRARASGGPAVISGVAFDLGVKKMRLPDPIALLAGQILSRKAATPRWVDSVEAKLKTALASQR
jgi:hypothetical protein